MAAAAVAALSSCNAYKRLGYIQDMEEGVEYSTPLAPDARIAQGDKVGVTVHCSTPELAAPFNVLNGLYYPSIDGVVASDATEVGYEVDGDGNIDYPVLGKIHVEGMTLKQVSDEIQSQIISRKLIKDPLVDTKFTNFNYTIIGESSSGVYSAPGGKVDLFEAIAKAKDLKDDAVRSEIWVVRTDGGKRKLYTVDLKTKDCYYSPAFYLRQNDLVYVKPRKGKWDSTTDNRWKVISSCTTILGTALNTAYWIYTFTTLSQRR